MTRTNKTDAKISSAVCNYIEALRGNSEKRREEDVSAARQRVINDLTDTSRFLKLLGADKSIWQRFYHIAHALDDLKYGRVSPILMADKAHNRRSDNSAVWSVRAKIAVAIECLSRSGMSLDEATRIVSRRQTLRTLLRPGANLKTASLNWLRNLRIQKIGNFAAQSLWDEFVGACAEETKRTSGEWKAVAERWLSRVDEDLELLQLAGVI